MRIRELQEVLFAILLILVLLQSGMEATNYVILSWTKEGLRELRLAYRGRKVLATSVASMRSSNSVVFTRATNGIRLVETVTRYGAIDDCIVSSSYRDVSVFSSEFAQVQPRRMLHFEADIMDVYLGIRNLTDRVFLVKHSNSSLETEVNTHLITSKYEDVDSSIASRDTFFDTFHGSQSVVLSAKITSAKTSSFLHMFKPHLQVMKINRECKQFQEQAAKNLEMLSKLLDPKDVTSPVKPYSNNSDIDTEEPPHARRHRHYHFLEHGIHKKDGVNKEPQDEVNRESKHAGYPQLSATMNGPEENFVSTDTTSSNFSNQHVITAKSGDTEHTTDSTVSSSLTTHSSQSQTESNDTPSEHSTTLIPSERSLENTSLINNKSYNWFPSNMYSEQITDIEERADVAPPGSPEVSADQLRRKRDLLTGWMIFPGTKWCGDGDIAENKKDMGYHVELDKCCRRHDLCPLVISRLSWKYGMFNYRLHTLSHCRCDRKFRKCLKASSSPLAHLIGQIYFNVVGPQCFKFTQKSTCVERYWWGGCRQYANSKVAFAKKQRRFK